MIYIGIVGKVNKFRNITAWILGNFLEVLLKKSHEDLKSLYIGLIKQIQEEGMNCICSSNTVVLESFGRYIIDQMKMLVGGTFDLEIDAYCKLIDYKINLDTFEVSKNDALAENEITLKDFTIKFGEALKNMFGDDIWVKSVDSWVKMRDSECEVVIYTDVKTDNEVEHIKKHNGVLIKTLCDNEMDDDYDKISDKEIDYVIKFNYPVEDMFPDENYYNQILLTSQKIFETLNK